MKLKILLILLLFSTSAFAQMQRQKGSLALKNGDVLNGAITYYYDNPKEINFYNENGNEQVFEPTEVREILLDNGEKFVTKNIKTNKGNKTIVLQTLIESSKISLYTKEEDAKAFLFVSKDSSIHRLEQNEIITKEDGRLFRRYDNQYIAILSYMMFDRSELVELVNKAALNEKDIANVIVEYNKGEVAYSWRSGSKAARESNWAIFAQYSKHGTFLGDELTKPSFGQMVGIQYYFSKHSRHSIRLSFDHSNYLTGYSKYKVSGLGIRYEYAFKKTDKYGIYVLTHFADIAYVEHSYEMSGPAETYTKFLPRLSPGIGAEFKPFSKVALYGEVNHILMLKQLPKSLSVGLKYDFGKTSW